MLFHKLFVFKCVTPVLFREKHNRTRAMSPVCYQKHVPGAYTEL